MLMESISKRFKDHYESKFAEFGASPLGVDWGKEEELLLRYRKMLSVMRPQPHNLDARRRLPDTAGCFMPWFMVSGSTTPILMAANMIEHAKEHHQDGVFIQATCFVIRLTVASTMLCQWNSHPEA